MVQLDLNFVLFAYLVESGPHVSKCLRITRDLWLWDMNLTSTTYQSLSCHEIQVIWCAMNALTSVECHKFTSHVCALPINSQIILEKFRVVLSVNYKLSCILCENKLLQESPYELVFILIRTYIKSLAIWQIASHSPCFFCQYSHDHAVCGYDTWSKPLNVTRPAKINNLSANYT